MCADGGSAIRDLRLGAGPGAMRDVGGAGGHLSLVAGVGALELRFTGSSCALEVFLLGSIVAGAGCGVSGDGVDGVRLIPFLRAETLVGSQQGFGSRRLL